MGFIADRIGIRLGLSACLSLATLALIWLLFAREIWMFYVFAIIFGLAYGGYVPSETLVPAELFGLGSLGTIIGATSLFIMAGIVLGVPLAGVIFDISGSYSLAFLICVILCALSVLFSLILWRYKGKRGLTVSN
jgi:MFS family permease